MNENGGSNTFSFISKPIQKIRQSVSIWQPLQKGLTRKKLFRPNGYQLINFYKMTLERQISAEVGGPKVLMAFLSLIHETIRKEKKRKVTIESRLLTSFWFTNAIQLSDKNVPFPLEGFSRSFKWLRSDSLNLSHRKKSHPSFILTRLRMQKQVDKTTKKNKDCCYVLTMQKTNLLRLNYRLAGLILTLSQIFSVKVNGGCYG